MVRPVLHCNGALTQAPVCVLWAPEYRTLIVSWPGILLTLGDWSCIFFFEGCLLRPRRTPVCNTNGLLCPARQRRTTALWPPLWASYRCSPARLRRAVPPDSLPPPELQGCLDSHPAPVGGNPTLKVWNTSPSKLPGLQKRSPVLRGRD